MSERITASVLVELSGAAADTAGHLSASVDDRPDGLNVGRTQFYRNPPAGMEPGFLIWHSGVDMVVEAVNGVASLVGVANTEHDTSFTEYAQPGQLEIEITLGVPARAMPVLALDHGEWSMELGTEYADGTIRSVLLRRQDATVGAWAVGRLDWVGSASCYRVVPTVDAEYVMLLVSGAAA